MHDLIPTCKPSLSGHTWAHAYTQPYINAVTLQVYTGVLKTAAEMWDCSYANLAVGFSKCVLQLREANLRQTRKLQAKSLQINDAIL